MNDRRMQFAVGVVALGSVFIAVILAMINSPIPSSVLPWGRGAFQVTISLPQAPGVGPDTPVRKNGLLIGRVASIEDMDDGVLVKANIDAGRTLTNKHQPHVRTTVLGDATIDFMTTTSNEPARPLTSGETIRGFVDPNPFDSISQLANLQDDIQNTMQALASAGTEVAKLAKRLDEAFGSDQEEGRVRRFMDTTERAMSEFGQTMSALNQILGDAPIAANGQPGVGPAPIDGRQMRQRLRQGLYELPDVVTDTRATLNDARTVLGSADRNFRNLEGFTKPLGERGPQIAQSIVEAVDGLDTLVEEFSVLVQALNNRNGTIGQLIHNPELYRNINQLTLNANTVLDSIYQITRYALPPILKDVRIFTDKIATEPGRFLRGAIDPSPVK